MPGATACVMKNAPERLTSKIACQSPCEISSSGRPTWPRTPPALLTRMSTAPASRFDRGDGGLHRVAVADIDDMRAAAVAAQRLRFVEPASLTSQTWTMRRALGEGLARWPGRSRAPRR